MRKILIVGGGYAGLYTAWQLEKKLKSGEARVTLVDPLPYMTYQPFLPEVVGGHIEPRHAVVGQRRHLKRTKIVTARVVGIDHATKTAEIELRNGERETIGYDEIVLTAGAVSRTFPIPGVADEAIGLKTIEEAAAIRDRIVESFSKAASLPKTDPARRRALTFVVVGGGFAGIEVFGEMRALAYSLLDEYPEIDADELELHLIEAMGRIMPEVTEESAQWVVEDLGRKGAEVHLNTQLKSCVDGKVELSTGEQFESDLIVWTAGVMASPMLRDTDFPLDDRGRVRARADLRVEGDGGIVADAWACGDNAAVPDLTGGGVGGFCVPNAQHAVRQAKHLAKNIVAKLRGEPVTDYVHENLGAVAGLGMWNGVFTSGKLPILDRKIALRGPIAWLAHRGYHGMAMPSVERKARVVGGWLTELVFGTDRVSLDDREMPRRAFEKYASRPKPKTDEPAAPAAAPAPAGASKA